MTKGSGSSTAGIFDADGHLYSGIKRQFYLLQKLF